MGLLVEQLSEGNIFLKKKRLSFRIIAVFISITFAIPLDVADIAFGETQSPFDTQEGPESFKKDFEKIEHAANLERKMRESDQLREKNRFRNYERIKSSNMSVNAERIGVDVNKINRENAK